MEECHHCLIKIYTDHKKEIPREKSARTEVGSNKISVTAIRYLNFSRVFCHCLFYALAWFQGSYVNRKFSLHTMKYNFISPYDGMVPLFFPAFSLLRINWHLLAIMLTNGSRLINSSFRRELNTFISEEFLRYTSLVSIQSLRSYWSLLSC